MEEIRWYRARAYWTNTVDGRTGVYTEPRGPDHGSLGDSGDGPEEYIWRDGNYSCSCNRAVFFAGEGEGEAGCDDTTWRVHRLEALDEADNVVAAWEPFDGE
jgi:hypothetical protein